MRVSHYLQLDKRLKDFRSKAGIPQKEMASKLGLSASSYSNYENGYSEPPMETIEDFCKILNITVDEFFGHTIKVSTIQELQVKTYADIIKVIIALKDNNIPVQCSINKDDNSNRLYTDLSIKIRNSQLASAINNLNELDEKLKNESIDTDEYNIWIDDMLNLFKVPIEK